MSAPYANEPEKVHELLAGASGRYASVRATVVHTVDAEVAGEANRRFVDWRFERGSPGMSIASRPGPPLPRDFYNDYRDRRQWVHLYHQRPDLWREEIRGPRDELEGAEVYGGIGGERWIYDPPETALYVPRIGEREGRETRFSFMLDPSESPFFETFPDGTALEVAASESVVAGRRCVEVRARTLSWGYHPYVFIGRRALREGATDYVLDVDAEVGCILRVAARLDGREFRAAEVTEIAYDEQFAQDTFRLELAEVDFERRECWPELFTKAPVRRP